MRISSILAAGVLACALSTAAGASTVKESVDFTGDDNVSFAGFNGSLGTLTGVTATLSGMATLPAGEMRVQTGSEAVNQTGDAFIFDGVIDGRVSLSLGGLSFGASLSGPSVFCEMAAASTECKDDIVNSPPSYLDVSDLTFSENASAPDISAFLSPIDGTVMFQTSVSVVEGTVIEGPSTSWSGSGRIELTYNYTPVAPVPLPAGLPLLLTGLAGFAGLSLRKKRKSQV